MKISETVFIYNIKKNIYLICIRTKQYDISLIYLWKNKDNDTLEVEMPSLCFINLKPCLLFIVYREV